MTANANSQWQLWRQDDNGNRFLVVIFPDRESAEDKLAVLTHCQHKQTYWISEKASGSHEAELEYAGNNERTQGYPLEEE
jgi:hypothetical protein